MTRRTALILSATAAAAAVAGRRLLARRSEEPKGKLRSVWTRVGGFSIHARASEGGAPGALPVVLVHGYGVSGLYMVPLARRLAADFPVYAPDLPGHGRSDKPGWTLRVPELAEALRGWMDAVGLPRAALLGNSMGCQIVAELALRHPERVDRLILVGPTADAAARTARQQIFRLLRTAPAERLSLALLLVVDYLRAGPKRLAGELRAMLEDRIEDKLPEIEAPALVIRGGRDAIVPRPWTERLARRLGTDRVLEVPGGGHALNYSAPDALMRLIRPFLWKPSPARSVRIDTVSRSTRTCSEVICAMNERHEPLSDLRPKGASLLSEAQTAQVMLYTAHPDGTADFVTPAWTDLAGVALNPAGENGWQTIHPEDVARFRAACQELSSTGRPGTGEVRARAGDGAYRWMAMKAVPVCDDRGRTVKWLGALVDVEEHKRAQERLRLLWEAANVLLLADDPESLLADLFVRVGRHLGLDAYFNYVVNEDGDALRLESCHGIPEEEARKIRRLELGQAICGTVALRRSPIAEAQIQASEAPEVQLVKGYGIRSYACHPLLLDGRLLGTLSFASRDRDELSEEDLAFLQTIASCVAVAFERLRLIQRLRAADRHKDEFLAMLAHELRGPLAPIRNAVHLLRVADGNRQATERACALLERQIGQMVRLVDDLLDVSRIGGGKLELRRRRIEMAAVAQRVVETVRPLVERSGHHLALTLPPEPLRLEADPDRLTQVFVNLIQNAVKYTPQGGRIGFTAARDGDHGILTVEDTGIGIPAEKLPRIFHLFVQLDGPEERRQGGLGLGLTLVKRLVEMHGGTVEARSEGLGKGSAFVVRLPLAAELPGRPVEPDL